jgi:ribulose-5-phosphate 4-epimerase/fuculose-1-phosphate aldolase
MTIEERVGEVMGNAQIEEFLAAGHRAAAKGLMKCSSGNLSKRLDDGHMLATATRSWMETLTPEQVAICRIADGEHLEGPRPTVEIGFHADILRTRSDVNVVMHFQTPCATALACRSTTEINFNVIPEVPFYLGPIARVPYLLPGSPELAEAVTTAMQGHDLVILSNHGIVTVAEDYDHVIQNAVFFELACEAIVHAGAELTPLTNEDAQALLDLRQGPQKGV